MAETLVRPLATLSATRSKNHHGGGEHGERSALGIIAEFEAVFRIMSNVAVHEFHIALALLEELKRHPDICEDD